MGLSYLETLLVRDVLVVKMSYRSDTLKEAIVNKLKDYDAYIDNELPDYILVMLANKKTVSQISQDLELFLGDNTSRFSKWLKEVLEKPDLLSPAATGQKRSIDAALETKGEPASDDKPPPKRKIIVRSRKEEDKETNRSSTYKRLEIVHETTTHETTHCSSKQTDSAASSDKEEEDDEPITTSLASVIKKPDRKPQSSGRILMKAISAIQGSNSGGGYKRSSRKASKLEPDSPVAEQATEEKKDVANLLPEDLRKRLGKRNSQEAAAKSDEAAETATDDMAQTERVIVRPKFVITMNEVDDKYKSEQTQEAATEAIEPAETNSITGGKVPERCRYWPNCKNGDICPYHHPSIPCKLFPKCKFGDKCRFVHPICKFNAQCLKPRCPFLHTAPRRKQSMGPEVVALPSSVMMPPSYSWNPKGAHHKSNQYVWSSTTHVSERKFVTAAKTTPMPVSANI